MNEAELRREIASLPGTLRGRLEASGFDAERFVTLARPLWSRASGSAAAEREERNRVRGRVQPPGPADMIMQPAAGSAEEKRLSTSGLEAMYRGELALCVLAGGMATRMGGVVKALVQAFDGKTFLDLRLGENRTWSKRASRPVPLWLMTSEATNAPICAALAKAGAGAHVSTFTQDLALRLTPEGALFRDDQGRPSTYAPGHGDLPDALRRWGLLKQFVARGGKYVWIANLDNLGASIDPAILGVFVERATADVMVEVAPKEPGDRGGIPVWADAPGPDGRTVRRVQVLEEFRLPRDFNAENVRVFNTNTFLARAQPLLSTPVAWSWFEVEKKVGSKTAVQFERLLQELTSAMPAAYVRVSREGTAARFLPVKDDAELQKRRDSMRAVAQARGMI